MYDVSLRVYAAALYGKGDFMAAFNGQEPDKWNGLAYLLAELIEKYADKLDIDNLPVARMDNVHNSNTDDCSKIDFSVESRKAV